MTYYTKMKSRWAKNEISIGTKALARVFVYFDWANEQGFFGLLCNSCTAHTGSTIIRLVIIGL